MAKRETRKIQGLTLELEGLPPRRAFKALAGLLRTLGAPATAGLSDPSILAKMLGGGQELKTVALALLVHADLASLDPDQLLELADELLIGQLIVNGVACESAAVLDVNLPDVFKLLAALRFALELNFLPTSAGAAMSAGQDDPAKAPADQ